MQEQCQVSFGRKLSLADNHCLVGVVEGKGESSKFVRLHAVKVCGTVKELHSFLISAVDGGSSCSGNGNRSGNNKWGRTAATCIFCRF